ncbi:hypothetical protein PS1_029093 [Malus domestica]
MSFIHFCSQDLVMYVGEPVWALDWCPRVHQSSDGHPKCERSGIEKQKALEKAAKLQEKTDMFYATQNRMLPNAYRLFTVLYFTYERGKCDVERATRMGVEVKRMRSTDSKVIQ